MSSLGKVFWLVAAVAVVHGVQACSIENDSGAELNPQPLPPEDPTRTPDQQENEDSRGGGSTSSSSGGPTAGAGADGDAGDAGNDSGNDAREGD